MIKLTFYIRRGFGFAVPVKRGALCSWEKGYANHYSRTALKGTVSIGGKTYTPYIAEVRFNDGDFTNDGIYIDFNGNGEIEKSTEHVRHDQILHMDGTPYRFDIR